MIYETQKVFASGRNTWTELGPRKRNLHGNDKIRNLLVLTTNKLLCSTLSFMFDRNYYCCEFFSPTEEKLKERSAVISIRHV